MKGNERRKKILHGTQNKMEREMKKMKDKKKKVQTQISDKSFKKSSDERR